MESKKYAAFISYNSRDDRWARWLQKKLEDYRLPTVIENERREVVFRRDAKKLKVFRYVSDLVTTSLANGLRKELDDSAHLIVICSPNSARSEWVGREIQYFSETYGKDKIIPFIVSGTSYSEGDDECLNPVLKTLFPGKDLLGVELNNPGDDSRLFSHRKAVAKVVSLLIDVPGAYGFIWNRYRRQAIRRILLAVLAVLIVMVALIGVRALSAPFDWTLSVEDSFNENHNLPPLDRTDVTLYLPSDIRSFQLTGLTEVPNIPRKFLGKEVHLTVTAENFVPLDTIIVLGRENTLVLTRDAEIFGHIYFTLWDSGRERPVPFCRVEINGESMETDGEGVVDRMIPLSRQRTSYKVSCPRHLQDSILFMPCTEYTAIRVE